MRVETTHCDEDAARVEGSSRARKEAGQGKLSERSRPEESNLLRRKEKITHKEKYSIIVKGTGILIKRKKVYFSTAIKIGTVNGKEKKVEMGGRGTTFFRRSLASFAEPGKKTSFLSLEVWAGTRLHPS